jgi:hypothetical protein
MFEKPPLIHTCVQLHLIRHKVTPKQILGTFFALDKNHVTHYLGNTLELPTIENKQNISSIPLGTYECNCIVSEKYGRCIQIQNVANRSSVLIHVGNFKYQTRGCILVGDRFQDIDNDGLLDVVNSLKTMHNLWFTMAETFTLKIH